MESPTGDQLPPFSGEQEPYIFNENPQIVFVEEVGRSESLSSAVTKDTENQEDLNQYDENYLQGQEEV